MSHSSASGGARSSGLAPRILVAVLLGLAIVVPLCVFLYDSEEPTLWGFPFYFWFQFLLIPLVSVATFTAYQVTERLRPRERTEHGLPQDPDVNVPDDNDPDDNDPDDNDAAGGAGERR